MKKETEGTESDCCWCFWCIPVSVLITFAIHLCCRFSLSLIPGSFSNQTNKSCHSLNDKKRTDCTRGLREYNSLSHKILLRDKDNLLGPVRQIQDFTRNFLTMTLERKVQRKKNWSSNLLSLFRQKGISCCCSFLFHLFLCCLWWNLLLRFSCFKSREENCSPLVLQSFLYLLLQVK